MTQWSRSYRRRRQSWLCECARRVAIPRPSHWRQGYKAALADKASPRGVVGWTVSLLQVIEPRQTLDPNRRVSHAVAVY